MLFSFSLASGWLPVFKRRLSICWRRDRFSCWCWLNLSGTSYPGLPQKGNYEAIQSSRVDSSSSLHWPSLRIFNITRHICNYLQLTVKIAHIKLSFKILNIIKHTIIFIWQSKVVHIGLSLKALNIIKNTIIFSLQCK